MFKSIFKSLVFGLKIAFVIAAIAAVIVFFSAPVLFGVTLLTATAVGGVLVYGLASFLISSLTHFFGNKWYDAKAQNANPAKAD